MELRIGNCRVQVHFLFAAALALFLMLDRSGVMAAGIFAAAVHEGGHLLVLSYLRIPVPEIRLGFFDARIVRMAGKSYLQDIAVALAGPAANLLCAGFLFSVPFSWCKIFCIANLALAFFNLAPVESLDGGQALLGFLRMHMAQERAGKVVWLISILFLFPLAVFGFWILLQTRYNFSLLFASSYLILCLLLRTGEE